MGFNRIFWGMLFMFDFRIGGFDILPDIIGYILFFLGLNILENKDSYFKTAKKFTYPLLIISLIDIYQSPREFYGITSYEIMIFIVSIISTISFILLIYNVCKGIGHMARIKEKHDLDDISTKRWQYFLMVHVFSIISIIVGLVFPALLLIIVIPLFVAMLIVLILIMTLFKRAERELID